jgi:hypothetical protein
LGTRNHCPQGYQGQPGSHQPPIAHSDTQNSPPYIQWFGRGILLFALGFICSSILYARNLDFSTLQYDQPQIKQQDHDNGYDRASCKIHKEFLQNQILSGWAMDLDSELIMLESDWFVNPLMSDNSSTSSHYIYPYFLIV